MHADRHPHDVLNHVALGMPAGTRRTTAAGTRCKACEWGPARGRGRPGACHDATHALPALRATGSRWQTAAATFVPGPASTTRRGAALAASSTRVQGEGEEQTSAGRVGTSDASRCWGVRRHQRPPRAVVLPPRCSNDDKCCAEYEVCVSCCMHPSNNAAAVAVVTPKCVLVSGGGVRGRGGGGHIRALKSEGLLFFLVVWWPI